MKNLKYIIIFFVIALLVSIVSASFLIPANNNAKENSQAPYYSNVIEASDSNWFLKHIYIIHYIKPENQEKPAKPTANSCYKTFSKWSITPVSYTVSTALTDELTAEEMVTVLAMSAETWDASTNIELFNNIYSVTLDTLPFGTNDGTNALMFGLWSDNRVIAVTSIYYSRGKFGRIYDSDILFNTYFIWGNADINPSVMDLQNIATHELGHFIGLSDIYQLSCSEVTMYGYSTEGETKKRTLEQPDILGLQKLYGA